MTMVRTSLGSTYQRHQTPGHIAFVAYGYPTPARPTHGTFVEQLVQAVARTGRKCSVIHPIPVHRWPRHCLAAIAAGQQRDTEKIEIRHVAFVSWPRLQLAGWDGEAVTEASFSRAACRGIRRLTERPDAVYGHFLLGGGLGAVYVGQKFGLPSFVSVGSSSLLKKFERQPRLARYALTNATGVLAVSNLLKRQLVEQLHVDENKIGVFPNGADRRRFYPRERDAMRARYGFPADRFLIAYVGRFIHEKGVLRLVEAVRGLEDVGLILMGQGPEEPQGPEILFRGIVLHPQVPELLSAADVFVLPTLAEGSCNAIVEAMACGLPVITSRGEFNDDLVNDEVAIRIDPLSVEEIRQAIVLLRDDAQRRASMSEAALQRAKELDVDVRAERICQWMTQRIAAAADVAPAV